MIRATGDREDGRERHREFLSIASHDIRASLANVRSYAALLLSPKMELSERALRCAEVIKRNADRALLLLQEFFDAARLAEGGLELEAALQPLRPVVESAVQSVQQIARERAVELRIDLPPELPEAVIDRDRFAHALRAFIAHSIARSGRGERVQLVVRSNRSDLSVEVSDWGPPVGVGLSSSFDLEERVLEQKKLAEGFELALARAEIEAQGGRVGARANPGGGATFFFSLRLH
jgi:signal transduction histidine kinase